MRHASFDQSPGAAEYYTVDRLRRDYSLGRQAIYDALKAGNLVGVKLGKRTLIAKAAVDAWLATLPKWAPEV